MHKTKIASFLHHFCIISRIEAVTKSSGGHVWSCSVIFGHVRLLARVLRLLLVASVARNPLPVKFGKGMVNKR